MMNPKGTRALTTDGHGWTRILQEGTEPTEGEAETKGLCQNTSKQVKIAEKF
jgi:hypothetical protein